jgi:hypothetical protein
LNYAQYELREPKEGICENPTLCHVGLLSEAGRGGLPMGRSIATPFASHFLK